MADETVVKQSVRRVVQALHDYAHEHGFGDYAEDADWSKGGYYIDVVVNMDWMRVYVTFAAEDFEGKDGFERFSEVQNYLNQKLADDPELLRSVALVVRSAHQYETMGDFPPGLSDERFAQDFVVKNIH